MKFAARTPYETSTGLKRARLRFDLSTSITGDFRPGTPIVVTYRTKALVRTEAARIAVTVPELSAKSMPYPAFRPGQKIAPAAQSTRSVPAQGVISESVPIVFPEPGIYRIIVSAYETAAAPDRGAPVTDAAVEEKWVVISSEGGRVVEEFSPSLVPSGFVPIPGPFRTIDRQSSRIAPSIHQVMNRVSSNDPYLVNVVYYNANIGAMSPLETEISIRTFDIVGNQYVGESVDYSTGGQFYLTCPQSGYRAEVTVHLRDTRVTTLDIPAPGGDWFYEFDCGSEQTIQVGVDPV